ncbi:MAG: aminopeptidase [Myxococcaceae bacterium]|nr:aminopeptidase [Myxococcaceae bacterium]
MARSKSKHRRVQHKIRLKWKRRKERKAAEKKK